MLFYVILTYLFVLFNDIAASCLKRLLFILNRFLFCFLYFRCLNHRKHRSRMFSLFLSFSLFTHCLKIALQWTQCYFFCLSFFFFFSKRLLLKRFTALGYMFANSVCLFFFSFFFFFFFFFLSFSFLSLLLEHF